LSQSQDPSAAGWIMSMKNSNDTIGNRSRDLPVCSAVPQPLRHSVPPSDSRGEGEYIVIIIVCLFINRNGSQVVEESLVVSECPRLIKARFCNS
jgi:hypothetical protein